MNNNLAGLSVSLLLHGTVALIVLKGSALLPPSPPPQRVVPLTLAMFQEPPAPVVEQPPVVQPPPPKKTVAPPPKPPVTKRTVPRAEVKPPPPEPPRAEPQPPPPEPPPERVARIPDPAPAVPAAPPPPDPDALSSYAQTLAGLIARNRLYPRLAQLRGWQGQVEVQLHIAPGGRLVDIEITRSSGFEVLDRQALEMVQRSRPLPAPPEALRGRRFTVLVPVVFRLQG